MNTRLPFISRAAAAAGMFLRRVWQPRRLWQAVRPGPSAVRGAEAAVLAAGVLVYLAFIARTAAAGPWQFAAPGALLLLAAGGLLLFLGQGIAWLIGLLAAIPWRLRWAVIGVFGLINISLMGAKNSAAAVVSLVVIALAGLAGAGAHTLRKDGAALTRLRRAAAWAGLSIGALGLLGGLVWYLLWRGTEPSEAVNAAAQSGAPQERVSLPDPSQPGPFAVKTLTYGSGTDRYRPEFGREAALKTLPVDGSILLEGSWKGFTGQLRTLAWGFGPDSLPINGRVWYPDGPGPFPLVLMVHGNHNMMDFSDPGYAYLGGLLASRGYIFVSVDENFINGGLTDLVFGFSGENDARGWLLLEHLETWMSWNRTPGSPFYKMVDPQRIAVGGHSRGGEAAAIAAAFNRLPAYPDNAALKFNYGYNIRAVAAVAPIDGQYNPAWRATPLSDVNYFVIHGSHDSDVTSFSGINQYDRVALGDDGDFFKAAVYIYRANHGQFNTTWGDDDRGGLVTGFLNRAALMDGEDQRQAARVYLSAFFDAALKDERGYLPLFQDARAAGEGWLPDSIYINRFDRSGDLLAAGFQEDIDLHTATLPGSSIQAEAVDLWREQRVQGKWGGREASAVYLGWNEDETASYTITLPEEDLGLSADGALIFSLADALQDPAPADGSQPEERGAPRQPVDLTVVLEDAQGRAGSVRLGDYLLVQPQLKAGLYKAKLFESKAPSEPVLQSYAIPLADFVEAGDGFDPARTLRIRFVFDRTPRGSIVLDNIGFRR